MSWENLKDAYRTRLGNLTAKSVLVLIVDEANAEGLAFVGLDRVATLTEINKRTALRIVQVFGEIDLVTRTEAWLKGKRMPAFQVNLTKLGLDLCSAFAVAYAGAQRKKGCGKRLSDMGSTVSETRSSVSETAPSVAETFPPHPHIGGPLLFPLRSPTPVVPLQGTGATELAIERAVDQVCSALGIANRRKRKLLADVVRLEAEKGDPPATVALSMIAAWNRQAQMSHLLHRKFGLVNFFGLGIWKDERRWLWNEELLRQQAQASVGSAR